MTLFKLNAVSSILIEDDFNVNIIPLLKHLVENKNNTSLNVICYDQPAAIWRDVFNDVPIQCYEKYVETHDNNSNKHSMYIIDSVNQMAVDMGWSKCLKLIRKLILDYSVSKIILILHKDCLLETSKHQIHLNHIVYAIISFDSIKSSKVNIQIKNRGKYIKTEECLVYDNTNRLIKLNPAPKANIINEEPEKVLPTNLTTFKIETDQIEQIEKNKLILPYMSKIKEGQGKVFYEPDAVDDWDEEDPDDDLDI